MKESYGKDPASHPDTESCVGERFSISKYGPSTISPAESLTPDLKPKKTDRPA